MVKPKIESNGPVSGYAPTLKATIDSIRKKHGDSSIVRLGDADALSYDVQFLPTGIFCVDDALGGGFAKGRITELFGQESSAKTTLAFYAIAAAQRAGQVCAFIDTEHAIDPSWARKCGVDTSALLLSQPDNGEQAWEIVLELTESKAIGVICVDSITAMTPQIIIDGDMTDASVAAAARMNSKGLAKLVSIKHETALIFINQIRANIGNIYGPSETTTGGRGWKFYASVRVKTTRKGAKADQINVAGSSDPAGLPIEIEVIKNKVAPPFRRARFDLLYDSGVDLSGAVLDAALDAGAMSRSGAWFYDVNGEQIAQGRLKAKQYITDNPDFEQKLRELIVNARKRNEESEE
jgi:recombination protein RecA